MAHAAHAAGAGWTGSRRLLRRLAIIEPLAQMASPSGSRSLAAPLFHHHLPSRTRRSPRTVRRTGPLGQSLCSIRFSLLSRFHISGRIGGWVRVPSTAPRAMSSADVRIVTLVIASPSYLPSRTRRSPRAVRRSGPVGHFLRSIRPKSSRRSMIWAGILGCLRPSTAQRAENSAAVRGAIACAIWNTVSPGPGGRLLKISL
jgi:hypothetical protein